MFAAWYSLNFSNNFVPQKFLLHTIFFLLLSFSIFKTPEKLILRSTYKVIKSVFYAFLYETCDLVQNKNLSWNIWRFSKFSKDAWEYRRDHTFHHDSDESAQPKNFRNPSRLGRLWFHFHENFFRGLFIHILDFFQRRCVCGFVGIL